MNLSHEVALNAAIDALVEMGYDAYIDEDAEAIAVVGSVPCHVKYKAASLGLQAVGAPGAPFERWHAGNLKRHGAQYDCTCEAAS